MTKRSCFLVAAMAAVPALVHAYANQGNRPTDQREKRQPGTELSSRPNEGRYWIGHWQRNTRLRAHHQMQLVWFDVIWTLP